MSKIELQKKIKNLYDELHLEYKKTFGNEYYKEKDEEITAYWEKILVGKKYTAYKGIESYVKGRISSNNREYTKAKDFFKTAININDYIVYPYNRLGIVYDELKEYYNAIKSYKEAINIDDKYHTAYNNIGTVYKTLNDIDKAIRYYKKAIKLNNTISFYYSNLAFALEDNKILNDAKNNFELYVEKEDDKHRAYQTLMSFYIRNNISDKDYIAKYKNTIGKDVDSYDQYLIDRIDKKETSKDKVVNEKFTIEKKILETDTDLLNGFIIFIDLCNSTSFKQKMKEEWYNRLIHFYKSSEEFLRETLKEFEENINLLKYIGDEVMFFIEDKSLKKKGKFLKAIMTYLNSVRDNMNTVYFINKKDEKNMISYEKNDEKIDIKTCITYVEKVKKYKINTSQFDILGTPVDFSARLMSLCKENIIVCNHDFVELFKDTNYSKDFKNLGKFELRGFDDKYEKKQDVYIYDYNNVMSIIDNKYLDDNSEIKKDLIGRLFLKDHNIS